MNAQHYAKILGQYPSRGLLLRLCAENIKSRAKRSENHHQSKIGEFRAQTPFPRKTRIYPHTSADQPLQEAQIAAQRRSTRRTSRLRPEISALRERPAELGRVHEGSGDAKYAVSLGVSCATDVQS
jgi:hypothetical protein